MFYTRNKICEYPNMSILEDMLSRAGAPDKYSFTPYNGQKRMLSDQFKNKDDLQITVLDIVEEEADYDFHKARPTDEGVDRDLSANEIKDYYQTLEEISETTVVRYVRDAIIGYKRHNNGLAKRRHELSTYAKFYDDEDEAFVDPQDVFPEEEDFTNSECIEAMNKLPYLLKQLHEGSIKMKGSLLSFIIAREKFMRANEGTSNSFTPKDAIAAKVYRMNIYGEIYGEFIPSDNTGDIYRNLFKWICGGFPDDMYYKAYGELMRVLNVLEVDITKEDAREYTSTYIDKIVCTYMASNEEYLETYGFIDKKILNLLQPENLFKVAKQMDEDNEVLDIKPTVIALADNIATNCETLRYSVSNAWKDNVKAVNRLLRYLSPDGKSNASMLDFGTNKDFVVDRDGKYLFVNVDSIYSGKRNAYALISITGYLVILEPIGQVIHCIPIDSALRAFEGGGECECIKFNF